MDNQERTLARKNTYQLLGSLFLDGISPRNSPYIRSIPELNRFLPEHVNMDEMAAEYYRVFSQEVFPYESIFRHSSGLLGGAITARGATLLSRERISGS